MTYDRQYAVVQANGRIWMQTHSLGRAEQCAIELRGEGLSVEVRKSDRQHPGATA